MGDDPVGEIALQTSGNGGLIEIDRSGGCLVLRNLAEAQTSPNTTHAALVEWAITTPDATFLAEREGGSWRRLSYAEALARVNSLARKLLTLGCSAGRPLAIISENSIDHALLVLAAMSVGIPAVPISVAYATLASDFSRLRYMVELVQPGAIYVGDPERCADAASAIADLAPLSHIGCSQHPRMIDLDALTEADAASWEASLKKVGPDTIAKLMFTSGSTGKPKAVINTQRMLASNQAMLRTVWPILREAPPVLVDWLPWSHTFGANFTFNLALFNGGAFYIDRGKPVPQAIGVTIDNLVDVRPTVYFNVPSGFEALLERLRVDANLAKIIFSRMEFAFFAAAALPQSVRDELASVAFQATGRELAIFTGWGSTETAPCATATWWNAERSDNIGLPLPGVELKLAPDGEKLELRVKGPNVTPGYWRAPDSGSSPFDAEGFYCMGDAGLLIEAEDTIAGVKFDGRVSENFKLKNGTWVSVGAIRLSLVNEGRPVIRDVVVAGSGKSEVGVLVFINHQACRDMIGSSMASLTDADVSAHPEVINAVRRAISSYNGIGRGSTSRVARFLVLPDHPRIEAFEITDKGYLNQQSTLASRSALVDKLYEDPHTPL